MSGTSNPVLAGPAWPRPRPILLEALAASKPVLLGLRGPDPALFLSVKKEIGRGLGLKAPTVQGLKIPAYFQKEKPYSGYPL